MHLAFSLFERHGLVGLFLAVLVEQIGVPVPALPFLMLAGVAAANDGVLAVQSLLVATAAAVCADLLWFAIGRRYGRRVLALLCRISISPDSCVRQSELSFARRGVVTLVLAKFIPGVSTMAAPLAGSIRMPLSTFLLFDFAGTVLWAGAGIAVGVLAHAQVDRVLSVLAAMGSLTVPLVLGLLLGYLLWRGWRRRELRRAQADIPRLQPRQLAGQLARGDKLLILDVRAPFAANAPVERLPGALALDLAVLAQHPVEAWSELDGIVIYCACPNDASALKAAQTLRQRGLEVSVLSGGLDGWQEAGYALERTEPVRLP